MAAGGEWLLGRCRTEGGGRWPRWDSKSSAAAAAAVMAVMAVKDVAVGDGCGHGCVGAHALLAACGEGCVRAGGGAEGELLPGRGLPCGRGGVYGKGLDGGLRGQAAACGEEHGE